MFRKFMLASLAVATLATASLSATPASAHHFGGGFGGFHHGWGHGYRYYAGGYGYDSCLRTRWVMNRYGHMVLRTFNVCY